MEVVLAGIRSGNMVERIFCHGQPLATQAAMRVVVS